MAYINFEFPEIIKYAVKGLDNETRWKIVEYLISNDDVSYSKLLKDLNIRRKGSLTFALNMLSKGAMVERREDFGAKTGERVFYGISPLGKDIINGLLSALVPGQRNVVAQTGVVFDDLQMMPEGLEREAELSALLPYPEAVATTSGRTSPTYRPQASQREQMLITAATRRPGASDYFKRYKQ